MTPQGHASTNRRTIGQRLRRMVRPSLAVALCAFMAGCATYPPLQKAPLTAAEQIARANVIRLSGQINYETKKPRKVKCVNCAR